MAKQLSGAGLRGQVAGKTALSTVGKSGSGLTYRGYDVKDLAEKCQFEEVAYLILKGNLPNQAELDDYKTKLRGMRGLPDALKDVLERIPKNAHPMDVLRTGCSMLGNLEMETSFDEQQDVTDRMLACFPSIICYWYRFSHDGVRIDVETDDDDPSVLEIGAGLMPTGGRIIHVFTSLTDETTNVGTPINAGRASGGDNRFSLNRSNDLNADTEFTVHLKVSNPNPAPIIVTNAKPVEALVHGVVELPLDHDITGAGVIPNFEDTALSVTVPSAGRWRLEASLNGHCSGGADDDMAVRALITNAANGKINDGPGGGTELLNVFDTGAASNFGGTRSGTLLGYVPTTGPETFKVRAAQGSDTPLHVIQAGSTLRYERVPLNETVNTEGLVPEDLPPMVRYNLASNFNPGGTAFVDVPAMSHTITADEAGRVLVELDAEARNSTDNDQYINCAFTLNGGPEIDGSFAQMWAKQSLQYAGHGASRFEVDVVEGDVLQLRARRVQANDNAILLSGSADNAPAVGNTFFTVKKQPTKDATVLDGTVPVATDIQPDYTVQDIDGIRRLKVVSDVANASGARTYPVPFKTGTVPDVVSVVGGSARMLGVTGLTNTGFALSVIDNTGNFNTISRLTYVVEGETP